MYRFVNRVAAHTGWLHWLFIAVAKYGIVFFALALLAGWWTARAESNARALSTVVWAAPAALLALGIGQLIGRAIDRARPYTNMPASHVLISRTSDFSFPSDHATAVGAVAVGLLLAAVPARSRRIGWVTVAAALLLAFSRVYVGAHYPGDVIAGLALGGVVTAIGTPIARHALMPLVRWVAGTPLWPLVSRSPTG
jgi:membrane-associated phospholipid phosphatase